MPKKRRNRTISNSGAYAGVESESKVMVAVKGSGGESNIRANRGNARSVDR